MNVITSDWEVTTHSKGSAFDPRNKPVCLGYKINDQETDCTFDSPFTFSAAGDSLWVFFNAKFDIHWYRKLVGITPHFTSIHRVWCCQLAAFLLGGMRNRYPSLEETSAKYGLGSKIDVIKTEYWDKGIQTDEIPQETLREYCIQDVNLTYQIYLCQLEEFRKQPKLYKLFQLQCQDLLTLEEMEWNGQVYDERLCEERAAKIDAELGAIERELSSIYPDIPINFNSGDQLSAFLYGGRIPYQVREHVGFFKNGKPKLQLVDKYYELPRLVDPIRGSELKKDGLFKTDEETLRKLRGSAAKRFVGPLLRYSELEKLNSTYYRGIPKKNLEHQWPKGMIHGNFNQCVAGTGRLSSSDPNLQNFAEESLDIFITRYKEDQNS